MKNSPSIGIIGVGSVGASIAISVLHQGISKELILYDKRTELAEGEAIDLIHGSPFYPTSNVRSGNIDDLIKTDAIVISAGKGGTPNQSRLDLIKDNARIISDLAIQLKDYKGIVVLVTNPVDVLTYIFAKVSGLPQERVLGTGTMLDTARLRQILGKELSIDPRSVHAQVLGEHGDSEIVQWSSASVGGVLIRDLPEWSKDKEARIATEVKTAAYEIIKRKGMTNHAIGLVSATLLKWIMRGDRRVLNVCRVHEEILGIKDVALSLPTIVSEKGAERVLKPKLDEIELEGLKKSASVLRSVIESAYEGS